MTRAIDIGLAGGDTPVELDLDDFRRTGLRVGIFGASGTGKGWLLGKIAEGVCAWGVPVIMVDAEQELWTFKEIGALVIGGKHADAPFVEDREAIDAVIRFSLTTNTPVVFDIGQAAEAREAEAARLGELIAQRVWAIEDDLRIEMLFVATEASIIAPQMVQRGAERPDTLRQMFQRGRKRGVNVAIETQRLADIQKSCISQANVRFFGQINTADDWAAVGRNLPGRTFSEQQAMAPGVFYMVPGGYEVRVGDRNVTHGGGGPEAGDIQIREIKRSNLGDVLAIVNRAVADSQPVDPGLTTSEPTRNSGTRQTGEEVRRAERERDEARAAVQRLEGRVRTAEDRATAAQAAADQQEASAAALRERLEAYDALGAALRRLVGTEAGTSGLDEEAVRRIVRETAPAGAVRAPLVPQGALRERYFEQAAGRLVERVEGLGEDARETLLFLIAHEGEAFNVAAIARAIGGRGDGSAHKRFQNATRELINIGLAREYGRNKDQRVASVDQWVLAGLAEHNPTDEDLARVRDRALEVILTDGA